MLELYNLTKAHTSGFKGAIEVCGDNFLVTISVEDKAGVKMFEPHINNNTLEVNEIAEFSLGDNPSAILKVADSKFAVGCGDGSIYLFTVTERNMEISQKLEKVHSSRVCFMSIVGNTFASCSWDHKINIYDFDGEKISFKFSIAHHSQAVWCCSFLSKENSTILLSGSADATVCAFKIDSSQSQLLKTFVGHTQPVRSVVYNNKDSLYIYSCSNDFTLRKWDYNNTTCLLVFPLTHFLYSISFFGPEKKFLVVTQEEGMAVVSTDFYMEQHFEVKKNYSCWSSICFKNPLLKNMFAVCCDSGELFVYGQDLLLNKQISLDEKNNNNNNDVSESNALLDDPTILNEEYALSVNGTKEGEVKLARDAKSNQVKVYQWSNTNKKWELVGDALNKKEDEKKHDMTIDVEIPDDTNGGYIKQKLFVNRKDDPWEVANNFIMEHGLQSAYLEQIAVYVADKMKSELGAGGNLALTKKFEPILIMTRSDKFQYDILLRELKKSVNQTEMDDEKRRLFEFIEHNNEKCAAGEIEACFETLLRVFEEATGNFLPILDAFRLFALKGGVFLKAILHEERVFKKLSEIGRSNEKCQIMHLRILWNCVSAEVDSNKVLDFLGAYEVTEKNQMEVVSILNNVTVVMNERRLKCGYVDSELLKRVFTTFGQFVEGVRSRKCGAEIAVRMLGTMNNICCLGVEFERREGMIRLLRDCCSGLKGNEKIQRVLDMLD